MFKLKPSALLFTVGAATLGGLVGMGAVAHAAGGSIKGAVKLTGKAPTLPELNVASDPFCAKGPKPKNEEVVAGPKGELKNVVVRIAKGATAGQTPSGEVVLDQQGCVYKPRVLVAQAGQTVLVKNSDMTLHNVHTYKGAATLSNRAQPQGMPPIKQKFPTVGDAVKFKCDVHPWMTAWIFVTDNAFHQVTGEDGSFELKDVPPGKYTVEAWHERFGSKSQEVTVAEGKPVELKFDFASK